MMIKDDAVNLRISLKVGIAKHVAFDFSRFLYLGVPNSSDIKKSKSAGRDTLVKKWFERFDSNQEYTDQTKHGYIHDFVKYVRLIDSAQLYPESREAVELWEQHLVEKVRLSQMHVNSARKQLSSTKTILNMMECPIEEWFSKFGLFRSEINPTSSYSNSEIKLLIKILHSFFRQVSGQIIRSPALHKSATTTNKTATFKFGGKTVAVAAAITKCFSAGYFLLAYYTWANSSTLLKMTKPSEKDSTTGKWHNQHVLKPRANKYVTVSLGDNGSYDVPKYALRFIEKLTELSHIVGNQSNHLLFQSRLNVVAPLEAPHLRVFTNWLLNHFNLLSDDGAPLRPQAKRFRASGSHRYIIATGNNLEASILLGNTPNVVSKHYSSGNESDNNQQLQAALFTLEGVVNCTDIEAAKERTKKEMNVEVLPYEEFLSKYSNNFKKPQRTVLGTGCKDPYGKEADRYRRKINFSPKSLEVDHLACADILNCFFCSNQVFIEEIDDIWCLLSFKDSLEESRQDHIDNSQFIRNFSEILERVNQAIFRLNTKSRRIAQKKLSSEGRHPLWPEGMNYIF
ncbi:hypothetical protein [Aliikangiella sp. IMCC44359]|uniref:hypothetical protein n=1 Tax=Aliikangiella sp. IMCC44359 TaxID=3459125 RepID=UPI00403AC1C3